MSIWKIAWRSIQQRALASSLTGLSMALGVALVVVVIVVYNVAVRQFEQDAQGYHLVVGPRGGKLQLVLNTVFHLDQPVENLHYNYYREFIDGRFAPYTEIAVPYCLGDSYEGGGQRFRVVGTTPDLFDKLDYGFDEQGEPKRYQFAEGNNFDQAHFFEAVIGSVAASQTRLGVGDTFNPTHGISDEGDVHDENAFTIVGVLEPTGTANDRAIFVNMEGFYLLGDHALSEEQAAKRLRALAADRGEPIPEELLNEEEAAPADEPAASEAQSGHREAGHAHHNEPLPDRLKEVTAILLLAKGANDFESDTAANHLKNIINEGKIAQAVYPAREVKGFFEKFLRPLQLVLLTMTVLIVIVAGVSILVSIYNSMNERSHDIAVMRALGASRSSVLLIILTESILLSLCAGVVGILLGHGLIAAAAPFVEARTGVSLGFMRFDREELYLVPALVAFASLVGLLPAISAYRTDVAKALTDSR